MSLNLMMVTSVFFALLGTWVAWRYTKPMRERARSYIKQVSTCGFLAPPPTPRALRFLMRWAKTLAFIQVGNIKIVGRENLDNIPGPHVITPNHPHWVDVAVTPILVNGPARYMAAQGVFTFAGGLGALMVGPIGAFCADLTRGRGAPALEAGIKVLTSGQRLVMFPEGWAYLDGKLGPFKKGAVRIAREAANRLGQTTYVVPVNLRYGKYPGSWITKLPPPIEYALVFALFFVYRRGLTMVVGKPIAIDQFSLDDATATEELKQAIIALDPAREEIGIKAA